MASIPELFGAGHEPVATPAKASEIERSNRTGGSAILEETVWSGGGRAHSEVAVMPFDARWLISLIYCDKSSRPACEDWGNVLSNKS